MTGFYLFYFIAIVPFSAIYRFWKKKSGWIEQSIFRSIALSCLTYFVSLPHITLFCQHIVNVYRIFRGDFRYTAVYQSDKSGLSYFTDARLYYIIASYIVVIVTLFLVFFTFVERYQSYHLFRSDYAVYNANGISPSTDANDIHQYNTDNAMAATPRKVTALPIIVGSYAAVAIQLFHPLMAVVLDEHSQIFQRPFSRIAHTYTFAESIFQGLQVEKDRSIRFLARIHRNIRGRLSDPDDIKWNQGKAEYAYSRPLEIWVLSTLAYTTVRFYDVFDTTRGSLNIMEREAVLTKFMQIGIRMGIPIEEIPRNWNEFESQFTSTLHGLYASNTAKKMYKSIHDVLIGLHFGKLTFYAAYLLAHCLLPETRFNVTPVRMQNPLKSGYEKQGPIKTATMLEQLTTGQSWLRRTTNMVLRNSIKISIRCLYPFCPTVSFSGLVYLTAHLYPNTAPTIYAMIREFSGSNNEDPPVQEIPHNSQCYSLYADGPSFGW